MRETAFFLRGKISSRSEESEVPPLPFDALRCWLNQGAAPGCAPYLSRCLLGEKLRSTSTANIAECGHCRGTYIGTGKGEEKLGGLRVETRIDLHLPPLLFLFFFFVLLFFLHYCSLWLREITISIDVSLSESDPRKQCYTWHCFAHLILLHFLYEREKELIEWKLESN